jgi:ribonuclease HI
VTTFHLETDAALNPAKVKKDADGTLLTLAGGGIILRTEAMRLVATYAVELGYVKGPHEAEAMAILRGMEIARDRHRATTLRVRTDNLPLVRALAGEIMPRSARFVAALDQLREERERFEEVEFRWAPGFHGKARSDGVPSADVLARKAAGLDPR